MKQTSVNGGEDVAAWLQTGAEEKADSVVRLAPPSVRSVVDIGAGTGAVLSALDRREFGQSYWACEPSPDLAAQIPRIPRLRAIAVSTFADAFQGEAFDLAVLSHVLVHVRSPAALLAQAIDRATHVVVELPIEASALTRLRTVGQDRKSGHSAGHIHFFSRSDARKLVALAGGQIQAERGYFPFSPYRHIASGWQQRVMLAAAARCEPLARMHYEHFAMLVTGREYAGWQHHYPRP